MGENRHLYSKNVFNSVVSLAFKINRETDLYALVVYRGEFNSLQITLQKSKYSGVDTIMDTSINFDSRKCSRAEIDSALATVLRELQDFYGVYKVSKRKEAKYDCSKG